jgi:predicted Fe-Mo cluster-binding NifX family protein
VKVIVTSTGNSLESTVDPRFGRCQRFMIVDTETLSHETVPNRSLDSQHGAGIGAAQSITRLNAQTVITGHIGPNAHMALSAAGIEVYTGAMGTIKNAIDMFKKGELVKATSPTVKGHFGQGRGRGRSRV